MTADAAASAEGFAFTAENRAEAEAHIAKYPAGCQASAVLPLLDLAQRQNGGWISRVVMEHVGEMLDMAPIRVYEVATFYSMLNLEPVGHHHVQLCRTTPLLAARLGTHSATPAARSSASGSAAPRRTASSR